MANITLNGGKLYIKPDGEENFRYFGTTDSMSVNTQIEKQEHINTEGAIPTTDAEVITKQSATLSWTSADMSAEMMAFAFRGETLKSKPQTTLSIAVPSGAQLPFVVQTQAYGATSATCDTLSADDGDFAFDARTGLIEIKSEEAKGATLAFTFVGAKEKTSFDAFKTAKTMASLLFISDAAIGNAFKYEFYRVNIAQNGEMSMKSASDFMSVGFEGTVLKDDTKPEGEQFFKVTQL